MFNTDIGHSCPLQLWLTFITFIYHLHNFVGQSLYHHFQDSLENDGEVAVV